MLRVRPGDSLLALARRCQLPTRDLMAANGLSAEAYLWPGRALQLPRGWQCSARIEPAPTIGAAGRVEDEKPLAGTGTTADSPDRTGESVEGAAGLNWTAVTSEAGEYLVQPGDTLSAIAERHHTTVAALQAMNGLASERILAGQRLRVVPQAATSWLDSTTSGPESDTGQTTGGFILVDISDQRMYVYRGDQLIWRFVVSTGMPGYPTRRGRFAVLDKIANAWSSPWQLWMPYWLGIYWAGSTENGIHGLPVANGQTLWGALLGTPISYGCIVLNTADAALLYEWAEIGTPVVIRD